MFVIFCFWSFLGSSFKLFVQSCQNLGSRSEGSVAGGSRENLAMSMFDLEFVMERDRFEYYLPLRRGERDLLRKGMKKLP